MNIINEMTLTFKALSENEGFARSAVAAFCVQINPTLDEIADIKTAISEAVTNSVVHAYPKDRGDITINVKLTLDNVIISVADYGVGIQDFDKARQPFFTTKPEEERSGMGFTVMESFMDKVYLIRNKGKGVTVLMEKKFGGSEKKVIGE
ncbi:MAG: anti-sigma F factor [Clostridia bacterium]|nr:anti-sigma F factor [Clostridia bacterium]